MKAILFSVVTLALATNAPVAAQVKGWLKVQVLEGEGAFNNIQQKTGRSPIVEIHDEQDRPLAGATVQFVLPSDGPSGVFPGGLRTAEVHSDATGRAVAPVLKPNTLEGRFNIKVKASAEGREGSVVIGQSNTLAGGVESAKKGNKKLLVLLLIAGAAGGGIIAGTHGGGSTAPPVAPPPIPTSLSVGTVTIGGPR